MNLWQQVCLAHIGDTVPCATACLNCKRISDALDTCAGPLATLLKVQIATTKFPRCCDLWQDGLGGMHCTECAQKTFAMMREIQKILGVGKDGKPAKSRATVLRGDPTEPRCD